MTWVYGALALLASSFLSALHLSFRFAGDAGVARFTEKYPAATRFAAWTKHWPRICAALLILWIALLILALAAWLPALPHASRLVYLLRAVVLILAVVFCVRVLPGALAESYADRIAITFLPFAVILTIALYPLAALVSGLQRLLVQALLAQSPDSNRPSSEDEIISVVNHADADDLEETEREMIRSVFEFGETVTREIMTHRVDIIAFGHSDSVAECVAKAQESTFSRFPVYAGSLDDVRGLVHVKDLLRYLSEDKGDQPIANLCNRVTFVPETMPIDDLFRLLRTARAQLALVVDEYGGTAGLVSMEDIIEELVGEIHDEYDLADARIQELSDGSYLVDAREPVSAVNEALDIHIPEDDEYDSVGGYVFHELGQIPGPGEHIARPDFDIRIQTSAPNRIINVRITKHRLPSRPPDPAVQHGDSPPRGPRRED